MAEELKKVQPWEAGLPKWKWLGQEGWTAGGQWQGGPGPLTWQEPKGRKWNRQDATITVYQGLQGRPGPLNWQSGNQRQGPQGSHWQKQENLIRVQSWDAGLPKGWNYSQREDGAKLKERPAHNQEQEHQGEEKLRRINTWDAEGRVVDPNEEQELQEQEMKLKRVQPWDAGVPEGWNCWQHRERAPWQGRAAPEQEPESGQSEGQHSLRKVQTWDAGFPEGWHGAQR